jgi:serine acetyltransferase
MNKTLKLLITDLVQAKIFKETKKYTFIDILVVIIKYRTARMHLSVRLRSSSNSMLRIFAKLYLDHFLIEIGSSVKIGKYFWMPHPRCIIIANDVIIGDNVHVGQYVTIGGNFKKTKILEDGSIQKLPILGNRINIHPGAVIGGPVTIKDDVIIGANSVVTRDVPDNSIVFGQNQFASKKIRVPKEGGCFIII